LDILVQRGYDENCLQIYESMKEFRRRPEFWGVKFGTSVNRIEMERCQVSILRINLMLEKNSKRAMHGGSTKTDTKQTKAAFKSLMQLCCSHHLVHISRYAWNFDELNLQIHFHRRALLLVENFL
jgi:hypothetical protein